MAVTSHAAIIALDVKITEYSGDLNNEHSNNGTIQLTN